MKPTVKRIFALAASITLSFCAAEGALRLGIVPGLSIPRELAERPVSVPGATRAYYWQGELHVHDQNQMRRTSPFPPRGAQSRVVAVGDSLTDGYGVASEATYSALIEQALGVEVLNLGVSGNQTAQVLAAIRRWVPELQPDVVVYGVCINDFLELQISLQRSRFLLVNELRRSFGDTQAELVIRDMSHGRVRFRREVLEMRRAVAVPLIGMVLVSSDDPDELRIAAIAERLLAEADFTVVPVESYLPAIREHRGSLTVSRWERHPNAEAHRLYAEALGPAIRKALGGAGEP